MENRPATREEILSRWKGRDRVSFETYVREVSDRRTEHGVRHIRRATATLRDVGGVPTVRRRGEDYELHATVYTLDTGQTFVASPTIVKR